MFELLSRGFPIATPDSVYLHRTSEFDNGIEFHVGQSRFAIRAARFEPEPALRLLSGEKPRGRRGANKDSFPFLIVPFQFLSAPLRLGP